MKVMALLCVVRRLLAVFAIMLTVSAGSLGFIVGAQASDKDPLIESYVPEAQLVGEAEFKVVFFKIYKAALYAPAGKYSRSKPFVLQIEYLVDADKDRIVSQSVKEMERQKSGSKTRIAAWKALMEKTFDDIKEGDIVNMAHNQDRTMTFWSNSSDPVTIEDKAFVRAFLNIWLGRKVRDKEFQDELFGLTG